MLPYRDSRITKVVLAVFFVIVLGYGYFEARGLLFGPSIAVTSSVREVHEPLITIKGKADRISSLTMNGKALAVTESGAFEEPYLLSLGFNRIVLDAHDKYGRTSRKIIEVVYTPATSTVRAIPDTTATTTTASSTGPVAP